jgi:hypothetical protein
MDKIKLKDEYIKTNLEYEKDITDTLLGEIEAIDEYLDFIFEHKTDELNIERNLINVNTYNEDYCPSEYYGVGMERGKYVEDHDDDDDECSEKCGYDEKVLYDYNWVEWEITYENKSFRDSFEICITPFVINIFSYSSDNHKNGNGFDREKLNIFTEKFYEKWNTKLQEIVVDRKRNKVKTIINDSYKVLGIDRQAKIKSILKEE